MDINEEILEEEEFVEVIGDSDEVITEIKRLKDGME